jgi:hypothetical protein
MIESLRRAAPKLPFSAIVLANLLVASVASAGQEPSAFPPRTSWRALSSSEQTPDMAPSLAIDGDPTTRWGGAFAGQHWLQVDLSEAAPVGGVLLHWDSGFAASYRIITSENGSDWQTVFETTDGQGGIEYVFFPVVQARYLRLASMPLSADWGVSVFEFEPLPADQAPRITGLSKGADEATVWGGSATPPRTLAPGNEVTVKLPRPFPTTGLEVFWGGPWRQASLAGRDEQGRWRTLATDKAPLGETSLFAARKPLVATELRLSVYPARGKRPAIRRIRLLPPDRTMTPLRRYEVVASRAHSELFPLTLRNQQTYWTVVGIPAGMQKSIFDEFGNLEAWKGAPMVQPLWRDSTRRVHVAQGSNPIQTLREGWMPMPEVRWTAQPGLTISSQAFALEQSGQPVTLLRHRLENTSDKVIEGEFVLLVRPAQINPPWQTGGVSPINDVVLEGKGSADVAVRVNGRLLLQALNPVSQRGASGFGTRGEDELTQSVVYGALPTAAKAHDYDGLAAAYLAYSVRIAPGEKHDAVLAFPLGTKRMDVQTGKLPEAPAIDRVALMGTFADAGDAFDAVADQVARQWQGRVGGVGISLPDRSLMMMLRAQLAYMLINQTGPAMQPGPRNYNRSFIRDGSATAAVLLRMGISSVARDYLHWYADHAIHDNGLVSPILNDDGTVNKGFGSDLEHDSQGEFVALVADVARLDGGAQTVREYLPKVKLALRFLKQLRDRTLVPGYLADRDAPERFRGLIAPSISHEGYSVPTHSYWDDFWALKGWHDGAWLASALGDAELDTWARTQYAVLRESVAASIRATMAWKHSDVIPSSADLGEMDPTSTSIALDPCGQEELLPRAALEHTFDLYLEDVRKRNVRGSLWAFTPYELRNVLTYVHLNRPDDANELLGDLLNYRRPGAWQQFAEVVHSRLRHPGYMGDMPHTWIGAEYVRLIIGMLMHEADDHLALLPGAPANWLVGEGVSVTELRTAYGRLTMTARQDGSELHVTLGPGLLPDLPVVVFWPSRQRPQQVIVDGQAHTEQTADSIRLAGPFKELTAKW